MVVKIAVFQKKGGVLKSSLATNLSVLFSEEGRTILLDLDSQSNVALSFGTSPASIEKSTYDLLLKDLEPKDILFSISDTLDVLPSNSGLSRIDLEVYSNLSKYRQPLELLGDSFSDVGHTYDYVFMDTPTSLSLATLNALKYADYVLIPFQPELYAISGLIDLISDAKSLGCDILGIVPTLIDTRTNLHRDIMGQLKEYADKEGIYVFSNYISRSIGSSNAVAYEQKPITMLKPKTKAYLEYVALYEEMKGVLNHETNPETL